MLCRGDEFRVSFALLGELRSILTQHCESSCHNSHSNRETLLAVMERMSMPDPAIVALPPEKKNIRYTVKVDPDFNMVLNNVISELKEQRTGSSRPSFSAGGIQTVLTCIRKSEPVCRQNL